ncbi:hypothetical protein H072_178 [Dactylellina haptotyla CBS 200.50]|uniref:Uncharacterized protein n=1 Tax=Dactylellina haptotyla (strain CBS 200.50) TaxID=1284197 RepID=S8AS85_DACHA|nr:hypothetical protein H072_178 [Dactylellina haptotyla CBS 200.50]
MNSLRETVDRLEDENKRLRTAAYEQDLEIQRLRELLEDAGIPPDPPVYSEKPGGFDEGAGDSKGGSSKKSSGNIFGHLRSRMQN